MKKLIIGLALFLIAAFANAQNGLTGIVVEKYYVSNTADAAGSVGTLPAGSVTWRVYADLATGYTLQAVYGVDVSPAGPSTGDHALIINTTTNFFNNEDYGSTTPNGISVTNTRKNSVMLDTWFSMSGNASGKQAVLKTVDSDGALVNSTVPQILQHNDCSAGIPINTQDGMIAGAAPTVTFVGFSAPELAVFDNVSLAGNAINTSNASIAVLGGVSGPTSTNMVLIGQFTTTGTFHFELNLQLGTPANGVEKWVASSPVSGEFTMASLTGTYGPNTPPGVSITAPVNNATYVTPAVVNITSNATDADGSITKVVLIDNNVRVDSLTSGGPNYNFTRNYSVAGSHAFRVEATDNACGVTLSSVVNISVGVNIPPTITITTPTNGTPFVGPAVVNINTNASDADGSVTQVEFFVDNVSVGIDNVPAFTFNWTSGAPYGSRQLKAIATDNNGATTISNIVTITVADPNALPYAIVTTTATCVSNNFCIPLRAVAAVSNVIGYDVVLHYDAAKVTPTGLVTVANALVNPNYVDVATSINAAQSNLNISLFFNGNAPANARFQGTGNIFCAEFTKNASFASVDTGQFSIVSLQESYFTGVAQVPADPGKYITYHDSAFGGTLKFWSNNAAMPYNSSNPSQYLVTNIYGNNSICSALSSTAVQTDLSGNFTFNTSNGTNLTIKKDIAPATSVQPVINGFDAFLAKRVLTNDASFTPTIFQLMAMDINLDGHISAGDVSQINQRAVLINPEFKQAWNYDAAGNSLGPISKDWMFVDLTTLNSNAAYHVSATYPADDGIGASKFRVPVPSFCLALGSSTIISGNCSVLVSETYIGYLMGDVNGNYSTVVPNSSFRANKTDKVIFDLTKAVAANGYADVPVSVLSSDAVNALDFSMKFNESKLTFNSVVDHSGNLDMLSNFNSSDKTLRVTSNSLQNYEMGKSILSVRFASTTGNVTEADLNSLEAYLNGERVGVEFGTNGENYIVNVFPNPANEMLNVVVSENATVQLMSVDGSNVFAFSNTNANQKMQINTANLASGIYMLKVYNDNFVSTKKVVIQK